MKGTCKGGVGGLRGCFGRININPEKIGTGVKMAIVNVDAIFHYSNSGFVEKHFILQFS